MRYNSLACLLLLLPLLRPAAATPLTARYGEYVVHEKRGVPSETRPVRRLEGHVTVPLRIALKQQNIELLPEYLMSVSDPSSASYGEHWSHEKVAGHFAPSKDSSDTVRSWLIDAGFHPGRLESKHNDAWIEVHAATVSEVETLLNTQYHVFDHDGEERIGKLFQGSASRQHR